MKLRLGVTMMVVLVLGTDCLALAQKDSQSWMSEMDKVYRDESHCLTLADMRGDKDKPISCFCRDRLADARYV